MRKMRKIVILIGLFILLTICVDAVEIVATTEQIGGSTANVVYVTPDNDTYIAPVLPDGNIGVDAEAADIINSADSTLAAAMNGNFFTCYYDTSKPMDVLSGNYPRIFGALVMDGKMINSGGSCAIGIDYDGNIRIGRVELRAEIRVGYNIYYGWGVNAVYNNPRAIYFLTDEMALPVDVGSGFTIIEIRDGVVADMFEGCNGYRVPQNTLAMIVGDGFGTRTIKVGDKAEYGFKAIQGDDDWSKMRNILGGSGLIVENGVSAVDNNPNVTAADQKPDLVSQRTFVAVLSDGRMMMGTVTSNYRAIAQSLIEKGVTDAMYLDGGASSLLYANAKNITPAGRKLASLLGVFDDDVSVAPTVPSAEYAPSSWAKEDVDQAKELGILPASLCDKYQQSITRGEFCSIIAGYISAVSEKNMESFCKSKGVTVDRRRFSDTADMDVACIAALRIVEGYPDGTFRPDANIKRQDAAIMLRRLAEVMGAKPAGKAKSFTDADQISSYAKPGVEFVVGLGIMNGHSGGAFAPHDSITREQAVITIMNTWREL